MGIEQKGNKRNKGNTKKKREKTEEETDIKIRSCDW